MRVLVMTEAWNGALASIQSFGRAGHQIIVVVSGAPSPHAHSKYVSASVALDPRMPPENRADWLRGVIDEHNIDLVIPISDDDVGAVAACRDRNPEDRAFAVAATESIAITSDKARCNEVAAELDLAIPRSVLIDSGSQLTEAVRQVGLPAIVKHTQFFGGKSVVFLTTEAVVARTAAALKPGAWIVQELIEGDVHGTTGFAVRGEIVDDFAFFAHAEFAVEGTAPFIFTDGNPESKEAQRRLVKRLDWHGAIDLDFIRTPAGKLYFIEANPRLSGASIFADKMGIDLPSCYAELYETGGVAPRPPRGVPDTMMVSVPEEARMISHNPPRWLPVAQRFRQTPHIDSLYREDGPLIAAQMAAALNTAWRDAIAAKAPAATRPAFYK